MTSQTTSASASAHVRETPSCTWRSRNWRAAPSAPPESGPYRSHPETQPRRHAKETTMNTAKRWTIEILIDEVDEGTTRAVARLDTSEDAHLHGRGMWLCGNDAESADDLAVSQALAEIANKLSVTATHPSP